MSDEGILVCLEGSSSGVRASEVAIDVARRLGSSLVSLAVVDDPDIQAREPTGIGGASFKLQRDAALIADAHAHAQAQA